jgi:hypothetical protein
MPLTHDLTAQDFTILLGRDPEGDDLERTNCAKAGAPGHSQCGMCPEHKKPRFGCGCVVRPVTTHEPELNLSKPRELTAYAKTIEDVRMRALLEHDGTGLDPLAEQHFCIALDLLSQARHQVSIASLIQARALGSRRQ